MSFIHSIVVNMKLNNDDTKKIYELNLKLMTSKSRLCRSKPQGAKLACALSEARYMFQGTYNSSLDSILVAKYMDLISNID